MFKIIYIARNPKDLCVSYYHYCVLVHGLAGTFEEFADIFLEDKAPIGALWPHVLSLWNNRHEPNILFLKYEDMKKDCSSVIKKCAEFMGVGTALTENQLKKLCDHINFKSMQSNPAVNLEPIIKKETDGKFIRKGQVGDWKNYMSPELSNRFDEWIALNTRDSDLVFEYE